MTAKPLRILVDLDGIVVDMLPAWLSQYWAEEALDHEEELGPEHITSWSVDGFVANPDGLNRIMNRRGFFEHLAPMDGATDGLKALCDRGHDVWVCTSPGTSVYAPTDKVLWCQRHLPFLPQKKIIIAAHKYVVRGDVLIDDSPKQVGEYREHWPAAKLFGISHPYNQDVRYDCTGDGWRDPRKAWETMVEGVDRLALG